MVKQRCSPLLKKEEIDGLFLNPELFSKKSFHYVNSDTQTYDENRERGSIPEEAQFIKSKLNELEQLFFHQLLFLIQFLRGHIF